MSLTNATTFIIKIIKTVQYSIIIFVITHSHAFSNDQDVKTIQKMTISSFIKEISEKKDQLKTSDEENEKIIAYNREKIHSATVNWEINRQNALTEIKKSRQKIIEISQELKELKTKKSAVESGAYRTADTADRDHQKISELVNELHKHEIRLLIASKIESNSDAQKSFHLNKAADKGLVYLTEAIGVLLMTEMTDVLLTEPVNSKLIGTAIFTIALLMTKIAKAWAENEFHNNYLQNQNPRDFDRHYTQLMFNHTNDAALLLTVLNQYSCLSGHGKDLKLRVPEFEKTQDQTINQPHDMQWAYKTESIETPPQPKTRIATDPPSKANDTRIRVYDEEFESPEFDDHNDYKMNKKFKKIH